MASDKNLASAIGKNTVFGILANASQVGTRLVTVPIVIHHLGLGGYGIWNIIMTTATYMRFGSVGVKTAFQKYVAEAVAKDDYQAANKLLSTGCAIMLVVSVAGLIPIGLFSRQIATMGGVPPEFLDSAAGAVSLLAVIMAIANVGAVFESIVTGALRIDLVRKFGTVLTVLEAVAIVIALWMGFGLFAMAGVMGASELIYIICCYFASRRVVPQIRIGWEHLSSDVLYELFRFAGSYQLVNLLEVFYISLLPFALLRTFGAEAAGVYAVVSRVVTSAGVLQDAFLPPLLSGGAMVYAAGSPERMKDFIMKAFRVTLAFSLFPLGFISAFGTTMAYAWTGQSDASFPVAFWLVCLRATFAALSLLGLVLYRTSGRAVLDNVRQVLRILVVLGIVFFARRLGFYGVLAGMAVAEMVGMVFMGFALTQTFEGFGTRLLLPDTLRLTAAAALMIGAGALASQVPLAFDFGLRVASIVRLSETALGCLLVAYPLALWTRSMTADEGAMLFRALIPKRQSAPGETPQNATL